MSCNCSAPDKTPLWSPIPDYRQPTSILSGENIDCYARRAGVPSGLKNDVAEKEINRIDNTSLVADLTATVNVTFTLTPGSTRTVTAWQLTVDGDALSASPLSALTFNPANGVLTGTVPAGACNQNYKVLVAAQDAAGEIDSREFNFFPKLDSQGNVIKFVFPLPGGVVTCGFGPRRAPTAGASSNHQGIDIALPGGSVTDIVAAADGTVVKCGPATGFGNWVVIEHRDAQDRLAATTVYGHMTQIYVTVGQKVAAGQKIALEGNAGIGTAAHLHFELHRGPWRNPTDPVPYLNGTFQVAGNNLPGQQGIADPATLAPVNNADRGISADEASSGNSGCPDILPGSDVPPSTPEPAQVSVPPASTPGTAGPYRSACAGPVPTPDGVLSTIAAVCAADSSLTAEDVKFIQIVAKIESNLDPFAKNPTSSATGLYQFLDALATKYYGVIGVPPTCANRCDVTYATQAMIAFYKAEVLPYFTNFVASGKTKIAGKPIVPTSWSAQYESLTQGEFQYGLIHHDGVGNAVNGIDKQGVQYYRSKVRA